MVARYVSPFPLPQGIERELLVILQEECAETIFEISKALRFGFENRYVGGRDTNRVRIAIELGHIEAVQGMLVGRNMLNPKIITMNVPLKVTKVTKFLQSVEDA